MPRESNQQICEDLSVIFIDLRIANLILGVIFVLVTVYWTSTPFKKIVPLELKVNDENSNLWGSFWNPALSYPYKGEQISTKNMLLISCLGSAGLLVFSSLVAHCWKCCERPKGESDSTKDHAYRYRPACVSSPVFLIFARIMDRLTGLLETIAVVIFVSLRFKLAISQPGPNYKDFRLQEGDGEANLHFGSSFPSAHASVSFAGFSFASLVLWNDMAAPLMKIASMHVFILPLVIICVAPLSVSSWIAITGVHDYMHTPVDILAGAMIGVVCSIVVFYVHETILPKLVCCNRDRRGGKRMKTVHSMSETTLKDEVDQFNESKNKDEANYIEGSLNESKATEESKIMSESKNKDGQSNAAQNKD